MELYEAIEKRRTIRKFKGGATEEQLSKILTAAAKAPSGTNKQNWEFVLVEDPALMEKVAHLKYLNNRGKPLGEAVSDETEKAAKRQKDSFFNASLVMVYCNKTLADSAGPWCCIENMLLAAAAEGLATRIARFGPQAAKDVNALMKAPEGMELVAGISIGIPDEKPAPRSLRPDGSWLHKNSF
jgi:nitroreductase